jgi:guanylate kinase
MLVLVGPSASGKSAIVKCLTKNYGLEKFITCTTRKIRVGEIDGVDYHFLTENEFSDLYNQNEFIETVYYNGNYYGTLKKDVNYNKVVILEPQGLNNFVSKIDTVFAVFLQTDEEVMKQRMIGRGDNMLEINKRLENDRILFSKDQLTKIDFTINTTSLSIEEISETIYQKYLQFLNK